MKARGALLAALALAAPGLLLATRVPGEDGAAEIAASALALLCAAASLAAAARPASRWAPPVALALGIGLLVTPPSRSALLADLPAPAGAVAMLALFHFLYPLDASSTPRLERGRGNLLRALSRGLPLALLAGLLGAAALLLAWLPDRLGSSRELSGPLGPVLVGLLAATATAFVASARAVRAALRRDRAAADEAGDPAVPEGAS